MEGFCLRSSFEFVSSKSDKPKLSNLIDPMQKCLPLYYSFVRN